MFRKIIKGLKDVWCGSLEFDTEPKKGSYNPVTSDGVYVAINGPSGAKEIVYFDVDPSDPPSGLYEAIGETLSNGKLPAIRSDGKLYQYTSTGNGLYTFVGVFSNDGVGYESFKVYTDDNVQVDEHNASLGYTVLPSSGTEEHPAWAKVCELELKPQQSYTTYGLALLFTADHPSNDGKSTESGILAIDVSSTWFTNSNCCNASWMAYTPGGEYSKILGVKIIGKYGVPSNPALAPYPIYKVEVWVEYYGGHEILVNALQNAMYFTGMVQSEFFKFPEGHFATPQSTEPSYEDTEEYKYKEFFYPAESPSVTALKSFMLAPGSDWLTFDGTSDLMFGSVFSSGPSEVAGDKLRMVIREGETKYCIEGAKLGVYSFIGTINAKWDGTPVNKTGSIYGFEMDFSKNFNYRRIGTMPALVKITGSSRDFYRLSMPLPASVIDAPPGLKISMSFQIQYLGNVEA